MDIESLENFVSRQIEAMDRLLEDSQKEILPAERLVDFIPIVDLPEQRKE